MVIEKIIFDDFFFLDNFSNCEINLKTTFGHVDVTFDGTSLKMTYK